MMILALYTLAAMASAVPHVIADRPVPVIRYGVDVRWVDANHVLVADYLQGVARVDVTSASITWLDEWPKPKGLGNGYYHLALSDKYVVASDFVFLMQWRRRTADAPIQKMVWESIGDVDIDGDRLLLAGLHRDEQGRYASDGTIAWLGTLSGGEGSLRPILPFKSLNAVSGCASFDLGKVRFLKDGSFIVVPGAEPGVYLFSKEGRVQRIWPSSVFGLDIDCDFPFEEKSMMLMKPLMRNQWLNRRAIIDEVIETPAGPAVIIRKVTNKTTHWDLLLLNSATPVPQPLPITSPSPWAHISGDVRGNRVVFVIADHEMLEGGAPSRMILMGW